MAIVYKKSDNIISSLGFTTDENFRAVLSGISGLKHCPINTLGIPEAFFASLIQKTSLDSLGSAISWPPHVSRFEKIAIISVLDAASKTNIDLKSSRTLFVLSTTKGNVDLLENSKDSNFQQEQLYLWHSAAVISKYFQNPNTPVVVSNACISGVSALIIAKRMLNSGKYDHAVVVGADILSKFIISGFQSFKALSPEACKPFDANRIGLNLGEGAATIILGVTSNESSLPKDSIILEAGAITNDANHISGPSRTGEGLYLALKSIMLNRSNAEVSFVNAHGTATPYNDEMESIALTRAGLESVPVNSLKGYFGHTLGAAGLLETIISSRSLQQNQLIKSLGYETCGVTNPLNVITQTTAAPNTRCIKMVSGFGGCNAAIMLKKTC